MCIRDRASCPPRAPGPRPSSRSLERNFTWARMRLAEMSGCCAHKKFKAQKHRIAVRTFVIAVKTGRISERSTTPGWLDSAFTPCKPQRNVGSEYFANLQRRKRGPVEDRARTV